MDNSSWQRASCHYQNGRLGEAHQELHRHLATQGECGRSWELLGLVYHAWGRWSQARVSLEEASIRVPLGSTSECALGDCYLKGNRSTWASSLYQRVASRKDAAPQALLDAATGLDLLEQSSLSVDACRRAIQLEPDMAQAYFDLSYYLGRCGAPPTRVEAMARKAIHLAPENLTFRIGLAGFLHARSRSHSALELVDCLTFEQVQTLSCPCCLERLIGVFEAAGEIERAGWCRQHQEWLALPSKPTELGAEGAT
jgi:Flp pilus assembly protein TadD